MAMSWSVGTNGEQGAGVLADEEAEVGGAEVELPLELLKRESSSEGWQPSVGTVAVMKPRKGRKDTRKKGTQTAQSTRWTR